MKKDGICLFGDMVAFAASIDIQFNSSKLAMSKRDQAWYACSASTTTICGFSMTHAHKRTKKAMAV